ncbi:MAG: sigma-70 family RNA polymerase sigma factor [Nannocystaceae bacterium]|nr:sigma-70 family RNA polymerase sigma factor [Nannocystaceae bacterium]
MGDLDVLLDRARARWPGLTLDREILATALQGAGLASDAGSVALEEFVLAQACAAGDAVAIAAFEREYVALVPRYLARIEPEAEVIDEVRQRVRARVLVAEPGRAPRIAEYSGKGPLGAWLRVVARSVHSNLRRDRPAPSASPPSHALLHKAGPPLSPELAALHERYLPTILTAIEAAIASLPPRDRTLFKLHYLDGLALEAIGRMHGVHKATVSRWLAAARQQVQEQVTAALAQAAGTAPADARSLLLLLESQLDVSLARVLAASAA